MYLYDGMILTFILIGIIIIIVSFLFSKYDHYVEEEENKKHIKRVDERIDYDEVRDKILELNEYGEYLKAELDKKHKELLFLYQMILEKQKELQIESTDKQKENEIQTVDKQMEKQLKEEKGFNEELQQSFSQKQEPISQTITTENPDDNKLKINYNKEILDLSLAGYKTQEIAKKLKIGQGQVELVLNLYK